MCLCCERGESVYQSGMCALGRVCVCAGWVAFVCECTCAVLRVLFCVYVCLLLCCQ